MSKLIKHLIPLCGAFTVALLPRLAAAQECGADMACPEGFECITSTVDVACPAIACAEGEECMLPECTGGGETYSYCNPKACDPDGAADQCGANMVCHSYESGYCSGSAGGSAPACDGPDCPMGDADIAPPVEECVTTVESQCTYKHHLPCAEAADCGAGFDCVPYEITSCSAGAGTEPSMGGGSSPEAPAAGGASGDDAAPAEERPAEMMPADCTTELSEEKYCQVIDVTCATDAECEEGWTCMDQYTNAGCATTDPAVMPTEPSNGTEPAPAEGGGMEPAQAQQALVVACDMTMAAEPPVKKCTPPGYYYGVAADGSVATPESGPLVGGGMVDDSGNFGAPTSGDPNSAPTPMAPGAGEGTTTGSGTSTGTNANGVNSNTGSSGKGCSMGSTPSSSSTGFAGLLLGLAAFALRRKR